MKYQDYIIKAWKGKEHAAFWDKVIVYVNRGEYFEAIKYSKKHAVLESKTCFLWQRKHVQSILGITSSLIAEHASVERIAPLTPISISFKLEKQP